MINLVARATDAKPQAATYTARMRFHSRIRLVIIAGACGLSALGGCQEVLFPADAPRTQFEIYDRMRNQYAPSEEPDVFGRPQPALRERLSQK